MNRLAVVALALALALVACSKAKKDAAPATTATEPGVGGAPGAEGGKPDRGREDDPTELARNQGGLGVSGDTTAFEPMEKGTGSAAQPDAKRKVQPVTAGAPAAYVVTIDALTVAGKPAPDALVQAVKVQSAEIQGCYDKAVAKKPDIAGTVKLTLTFLPTGGIANLTFTGKTLGQFDMENCVMESLLRTKVAKPPADKVDAVVTITFAKK